MKVNSKRNESHHSPCLSGLSQAPLIGESRSEQLTPISSHSLSHESPNRILLNQAQDQVCSKPHAPSFCSPSISQTKSSIFFPDPLSRLNHERGRMDPNNGLSISYSESNKNFDLNMNLDHERSRENHVPSSQDENYHLYHEPEEQLTSVSVNSTFQRKPPTSINMLPSHALDNRHHAPPLPPTPRSGVPPILTPKEWLNGSQQPPPRPSSQSQLTSEQRSPHFAHQDDRNINRGVPAPFSDRATSFRNDVADDVYFRYVTLKSAGRTNNRSRSYHGLRDSNDAQSNSREDHSILNNEDLNKNLSSVSAELPPSPALLSPLAPPLRDHCIRELLETERNYVCALEMIISCFAKPLEILLRREDNHVIFGHIRYFHQIHSSFQTDLVKAAYKLFNRDLPPLPSPRDIEQQVASNPTTPTLNTNTPPIFGSSPVSSPKDVPSKPLKISTCFLNMKEKFLKYGEYCATLSRAQNLIDELTSKNEAIAAQLDRCQQEANEGKFKLRDLLSLPMQRILKYHLLLSHLMKNTSSSSDDYHGLKRAYETMVDLGQYINEVKRDTEASQIMNEIEQSIVGLNLPPNTRLIDYGRLVTDGFIRIRAPQESRTKPTHELSKIKLQHDAKFKQKRYVFVFDKVILMCKLSGVRRYQYKEALKVSEYELDLNPPVPNDLPNKHTVKDKWNYAFNLYRPSDRTAFTFFAKTMEMKSKWVNAIQRAMDNLRPAACRTTSNLGHEFLMHTFNEASSCDHCGKLLLGLYYQGYRCKHCFRAVHKKCLAFVRACGPTLPPKSSATLAHPSHRPRCTEPPSPSIQSIHSDNGHGTFTHLAPFNSINNQGTEASGKSDQHNKNMAREHIESSSSFRENVSRSTQVTQRPVSSMINVSLQNSTNHLIQHNRLMRNSNSSPSIGRQPSSRVRAVQNFNGKEDCGEMDIIACDIILLNNELSSSGIQPPHDAMDGLMSKLNIGIESSLSKESWLFGRNLRTGQEGRFPNFVVERSSSDQQEPDESSQGGFAGEDDTPKPVNSYVNFPLSDQPWFNDRMDRDQAQAILEEMPHGTFLVRVSPKHHNSHVISLKYNNKVMHMRIYVSKDNQLYLSQNRYFNSLVELVSWYQDNSLVESFNMLDARLAIPYKFR